MTLQSLCQEAVGLHQQGRIAEAERLYAQILAAQPGNVTAAHLLGLIRYQQDRDDEAAKLAEAALAASPNAPGPLVLRGLLLQKAGRPHDALGQFGRALAADPYFLDALINRGNVLSELKRFEEALASYERALSIKPDHAGALNNCGLALRHLGRFKEALASFDRALAIRSDARAWNYRAITLMDLEHFEEALASFDKVIALEPQNAAALNRRGLTLRHLGRFDEMLANYEKALAIKPDFAVALINRANALIDLKRFEEAVASFDKALAIEPGPCEVWNNRAVALSELGRFDEAIESCQKALAINPDDVDAGINKCLYLLTLGRFAEGWAGHETRHRLPGHRPLRQYPQAIWSGAEDLRGKTLYAYWEQGLGDTIQFCRYLPIAAERGAKVVFAAQRKLMRLLGSLGPGVEIAGPDAVPGHFDYHIPLMSLALAFGTRLETIPARVPYLHAEKERTERWRARIGERGFKIGVSWQSAPIGGQAGRSYPLAALSEIARLADVRLISLQKVDGLEQLRGADFAVEILGDDFDEGPDGFLDTAAVMESLDLVITPDTSIAHLAGALGRPAWIALQQFPSWQWMIDRADSPWYPTLRLFRQTAPDDWRSVFAAMAAELAGPLAFHGHLAPSR